MNCQMCAVVDSGRHEAARALALVPEWFEVWEQCLSRFRVDSELSRLNGSAGWVCVSDVLWEVICAARWAMRWSDGLVTPALLNALEAAGYDRSFDLIAKQSFSAAPRVPFQSRRVTQPLQATGTRVAGVVFDDCAHERAFDVDASRRAVRLSAEVRLDLGGVAKGWAAQEAVRRLQAFGPALVDAGGDIAMSARAGDEPWTIGVADPLGSGREQLDLFFQLNEAGIATSGRDFRRWRAAGPDGSWQHHILDPRTERPATTDVLSATVIAPGPLMRTRAAVTAEVAAKTAFILGSREGMAWLEAHAPLAGVLVLEDGRVLLSSRTDEFMWGSKETSDGSTYI